MIPELENNWMGKVCQLDPSWKQSYANTLWKLFSLFSTLASFIGLTLKFLFHLFTNKKPCHQSDQHLFSLNTKPQKQWQLDLHNWLNWLVDWNFFHTVIASVITLLTKLCWHYTTGHFSLSFSFTSIGNFWKKFTVGVDYKLKFYIKIWWNLLEQWWWKIDGCVH